MDASKISMVNGEEFLVEEVIEVNNDTITVTTKDHKEVRLTIAHIVAVTKS